MKNSKNDIETQRFPEDILENDKPITIDEAAKYLGFSKSYLYKLTSNGKIPHYKPSGKIIFFKKSELNKWITKSKVEISD